MMDLPATRSRLDRDDFEAATGVSRETTERLEAYHALLVKWNKAINLVSRSTMSAVWSRHFQDSAQLVDLAPSKVDRWIDLGSGGGFPGLVVAAILAERQPEAQIVLVESDVRKAVFLSEAARAMALTVKVIAERAEAVTPQHASVVSARALAPLRELFPLVHRHLAREGVGLLPKGAQVDAELTDALVQWRATVQRRASRVGSEGVILLVRDLDRI